MHKRSKNARLGAPQGAGQRRVRGCKRSAPNCGYLMGLRVTLVVQKGFVHSLALCIAHGQLQQGGHVARKLLYQLLKK